MMKIGIITYHRSYNYGAQLQAYALRKALQILGHKSEVIDCNTIGQSKIFNWSFSSIRAFVGSFYNNLLSLISEKKRHSKFNKFSSEIIGISKPCIEREELEEFISTCDYVITGSDQVWHPQICEGKTIFFLDLPIKSIQKIAYAPSFGVSDYSSNDVCKYMPLINDISHLSVREETGQSMIKKYLDRSVPIVVDPTMLLSKAEWESLVVTPKYTGYLFYFTILDEPDGTDCIVRNIANERGLKVVRIGTVRDIIKSGFINARSSGPQEFLGLMKYADFVVTSSFHGTVFSILFEKEFLCILNNNNRNSRMETLTNSLGLSNHLVYNVKSYCYKEDYMDIDYIAVNKKLSVLRQSSLNFLINSIK